MNEDRKGVWVNDDDGGGGGGGGECMPQKTGLASFMSRSRMDFFLVAK